jgi:hypothetical protein
VRVFRIAAVALVAAFTCYISVLRPAAADGAGVCSVSSVVGSDEVQAAPNDWQPLRAGARVGVGYKIRTGSDSAVVLARQDEVVTVGADSAFDIKQAPKGLPTRFFQHFGTFTYKVHKRSRAHFEAQTPNLVAVVKGTAFTVDSGMAGCTVHVIEGLVQVLNAHGADSILVRPGATVSVASADRSRIQMGALPGGMKKGAMKKSPMQ